MVPFLLACAAPPEDTGAAANAGALPTVDGVAYDTVQAAIDAAPEGGTVYVPAGRFSGNLVIDKTVTVEGAGAEETLLAASSGSVVYIVPGVVGTLRGLEIGGGDGGPEGGDFTFGGGIWVEGSLYAEGIEVRYNRAAVGGGLFAGPSDLGEGAETVELVSSRIHSNTAHFGAALFVTARWSVHLVDTEVSFNTADDDGGWYDDSAAVDFWGPSLSLTDGTRVAYNDGGCGGLNLGDGDTLVEDAVIVGNTGEQADGACLDPYEGSSPGLSSVSSDWGADDAGRDVYRFGHTWSFGADATFSCDPAGCR